MDRHVRKVAADVRPDAAVIGRQEYVLAGPWRTTQRESIVSNTHRILIIRIHSDVRKLTSVYTCATEHTEIREASRSVHRQNVAGCSNAVVPQANPQAGRTRGGDLKYAIRERVDKCLVLEELRARRGVNVARNEDPRVRIGTGKTTPARDA